MGNKTDCVINCADPPEIKGKETVHSGLGRESDLVCVVHARPEARVKWYKNGKEISARSAKILIKTNETKHILTHMNTEKEDFGTYTCKATNRFGTTEHDIKLIGIYKNFSLFFILIEKKKCQ